MVKTLGVDGREKGRKGGRESEKWRSQLKERKYIYQEKYYQ